MAVAAGCRVRRLSRVHEFIVERKRLLSVRCCRTVRPGLASLFLDLKSEGQNTPVLRLTYGNQANTEVRLFIDFVQSAIDGPLFEIGPMNQAFFTDDISLRISPLVPSKNFPNLRNGNAFQPNISPFPCPLVQANRVLASQLHTGAFGIFFLMTFQTFQVRNETRIDMKRHLFFDYRNRTQPTRIENRVLPIAVM